MKFLEFKRFQGSTAEDVVQFLKGTFGSGVRDLFVGLSRLTVQENFDGWLWSGTINASQTVAIKNEIGAIPSGRIVLRVRALTSGTVALDDSESEWTESVVYLRNNGTANTEAKVFFLR